MNRFSCACIAALLFSAAGAHAQETDASKRVTLELNAIQTVDNSCQLTFLITNGHAQSINQAVYETVLFDSAGQVSVITLFDFGTLPPALPRVRQFGIPQVTCEGLGRVLINGASICAGAGLPESACTKDFTVSTRTAIEVIG
jgi:hypothetical protein